MKPPEPVLGLGPYPPLPTITPAPLIVYRRTTPGWTSQASLSSLSGESLASIWSVSCQSTNSLSSIAAYSALSGQGQSSARSATTDNAVTTSPSATTQPRISGSSVSYYLTTLTTVPLTLTLSSSTILTSTTSLVTAVGVSTSTSTPSSTSSYGPFVSSGMAQQASSVQGATCAGNGLDNSGEGVLATVLITSVIGLLVWLVFAILRPRIPQLYAVREWFLNPELRPAPLGSGLFAFLHPHVPLVPPLPSDTSELGNSPAGDARLFPSDEELAQRTLWIAFLIALGWTVLGLVVALPLYLASTPCLANDTPAATQGSAYSTLSDLSLIRLLKMLDNSTITTSNGHDRRSIVDGKDWAPTARTRLIVLTVLLILLGVLPVMWKLMKEFSKAAAYRERWLNIRCSGIEMGWLSIQDAPGFTGWGEGRIKEFLLKNGLSSGLDRAKTPRGPQRDATNPSGERGDDAEETMTNELDVQGLYTVPETHHLSELIDERKKVLDDLEIAETQYIQSFHLTAPDNTDYDPEGDRQGRVRSGSFNISQPRPLRTSQSRAEVVSGAPTSYIAPKSYYKLRNVGTVTDDSSLAGSREETFTESIGRGIPGSHFQEYNQDGVRFTRFPAISPLTGLPDDNYRGPNREDPALATDEFGQPVRRVSAPVEDDKRQTWPSSARTDSMGAGPSSFAASPMSPMSPARATPVDLLSPGIRPNSGEDEHLPVVYGAIREARSRLKALNADINDLQQDGFNNIAEGTRIKGWLVFGRGIRYIPKIQLIEGRSKEDVRWDELQDGGSTTRNILWWIMVMFIGVSLGASLVAVVGLAFAGAPNFAQYLPFLRPIADSNDHNFGSSIATTFVPAVTASLFIAISLYFIHYSARYSGKAAVSTMRLAEFKAIFAVLVVICGIWLIVLGGLLFATDAIANAQHRPASISEGTVYVATLLMLIIVTVAIISPGLLMLQPFRLWKTWRAEKKAITPRQRFRAIYPRAYNASFGLACCVLGIVFACAFSVIFPLIGPPIVILLLLTLVAHRYLVGYVFGRAGVGQTGGLLHLWLLRRFATLVALQPLLLGLILLAHKLWALGAILVATAVGIIIAVEVFTYHRTRTSSQRNLSPVTKDALSRLQRASRPSRRAPAMTKEMERGSLVSSSGNGTRRPRTSIASVLDMISLTLAVMPSTTRTRGPVPLDTEGIDDLVSTERANRTRPGASPRVAFTDRAEETAGMLYPPELLAPTPIVWLPNDPNGVGRSEAYDLQRYHGLEVTLDAAPEGRGRRNSGSQTRRRRQSQASA